MDALQSQEAYTNRLYVVNCGRYEKFLDYKKLRKIIKNVRYKVFLWMNFEKKNDLVCIEIKIIDLNSDIFETFR